MIRPKWYSPHLSREIVSCLYFKAKAERIPMTVLANRIIERALALNESSGILVAEENAERCENSKPQ
jgi:hypothetical protein